MDNIFILDKSYNGQLSESLAFTVIVLMSMVTSNSSFIWNNNTISVKNYKFLKNTKSMANILMNPLALRLQVSVGLDKCLQSYLVY